MDEKFSIGIDFGTEDARAIAVHVATGDLISTVNFSYPHGVIDTALPDSTKELPPDYALQDADDYLKALEILIPSLLKRGNLTPDKIIGIGVDFTSCSMLPLDRNGNPLSRYREFRTNPHAWVKLWKHHGAQWEAEQLVKTAKKSGEKFLKRYGGKISCEWMFPKIMETLYRAPHVFQSAAHFMECADWITFKLTGKMVRSAATCGYKAIWENGYPPNYFFKKLDPRLDGVVKNKLSGSVLPPGTRAGALTPQMAEKTGLREGIPVAVATIDAHAAALGSGLIKPGIMVIVMGTSSCHMCLHEKRKFVKGMCGAVPGGIVPGYYGYEAGQSAVGDIFAWFIRNCVPMEYTKEAEKSGVSVYNYLAEKTAMLYPGQSGLLALDWWNGNRSVLMNADLSGLIIGLTLWTKPEEIYRSLIEATAFGTRRIIEAFEESGIQLKRLIVCGGLPEKSPLTMKIYTNINKREIEIASTPYASALGAAILGAVAAGKEYGGFDSPQQAVEHMVKPPKTKYSPGIEESRMYDILYKEYMKLYNYFGRGTSKVMSILKNIKLQGL
ncbi:MAG: ribulokinase, partial [Fidelibacterota bacterium]